MIGSQSWTLWQSLVICEDQRARVAATFVGTHVGILYATLHPFAQGLQKAQCRLLWNVMLTGLCGCAGGAAVIHGCQTWHRLKQHKRTS